MSALSRLSVIAWAGLAAAGAMMIGSFGPWAKAIGLVNVGIGGTDGANDGWLVVGCAVIGAAAIVLYDRAYAVGRSEVHLASALGLLLAGAGGAAVTIHDRGKVTGVAADNTSALVSFQVGWGLNLAMGASIVLAVVGLVALLRGFDAPDVTTTDVEVVAPRPNPSESHVTVTGATVDDISQLADLHSRGVLTDEEFRLAKERMLPRLAGPSTPNQVRIPPSIPALTEPVPTSHQESSLTGATVTSRPTDRRLVYGGAAVVIVLAAVTLVLELATGDNSPAAGEPGNCPPGQTVNENGYCSS
jgi:hypothetical protein